MAHDLEIREDGTAAFLATRTPGWHGLGTVVQDDVSMEEALLLARMRYHFQLAPTYAMLNGEPVKVANDRQAVVRTNVDDDTDIRAFGGSLSDRYKTHTLLDMWSWVEDLLGHGATVETVGNLRDGASSFATVRLPHSALAGTSDETAMYLTVSTAHDGTAATTATVSPVRVVCANTLAWSNGDAVKSGKMVKVRHNVELAEASADKAREVLTIMAEQVDMVEAMASTLKAVTLRDEDKARIVNKAFIMPEPLKTINYLDMSTGQKRQFSLVTDARATVLSLESSSPYRADGSDGWSLYQAFVEYADYFAPVKGKDLEARRAERTLLRSNDNLKATALDLILA